MQDAVREREREADAYERELYRRGRKEELEKELKELRRTLPEIEQHVAHEREKVAEEASNGRIDKTDVRTHGRELAGARMLLAEHQQAIADKERELEALSAEEAWESRVDRLVAIAEKAIEARDRYEQELPKAYEALKKAAEKVASLELDIENRQNEWNQNGGPQFAYENRWDDRKRDLVAAVAERVDLSLLRSRVSTLPKPDIGPYSSLVTQAVDLARKKLRRQKEQDQNRG